MTLFFLILLAVSTGVFFYQRSRKGKKPIIKPSLPLTPPAPPVQPQPIVVPPPPAPTPVMPTPPTPPPQPTTPSIPTPVASSENQNPFRQRMAEIAEELKEPELTEPKKEFLPPPPNLPVS